MKSIRMERQVLGYPIAVVMEPLDQGWDVSLTGGSSTHVGAVTLAGGGGPPRSLERPGHRDGELSLRWAQALARASGQPVCVRCGIHYHQLRKEELSQIIDTCEELLDQALGLVSHHRR